MRSEKTKLHKANSWVLLKKGLLPPKRNEFSSNHPIFQVRTREGKGLKVPGFRTNSNQPIRGHDLAKTDDGLGDDVNPG